MTTGGEEGGENSSLGSIQIRPWQSYAGMKNMTKNQSMKMNERSIKVCYFCGLMLLSILFKRRKWDRILKQKKVIHIQDKKGSNVIH